jgi:dnd system-associated protein 4
MRRIQRSKDKEQLIQLLVKGKNNLFKEIWQLMIFAALIGWKDGTKSPLKEIDSGKGIDETVFSNNMAWPGLLNLLALVHEQGDVSTLSPTEEALNNKIKIFEEFANRGLEIIEDRLESSSFTHDAFLNFLATETTNNTPATVDWDNIEI